MKKLNLTNEKSGFIGRHLGVIVLTLFLAAFIATGCWKTGGSGGSFNPVGPNGEPVTVIGGAAVPALNISFVMPPDARQSASILASSADSASPTVTIKLTVVNVGDVSRPSNVILKEVGVNPDGTAELTMNGLPALPVIVEIIMKNCSKGGFREFHGGADLVANRFNNIDVSPVGSKMSQDILAEVMKRLVADSSSFQSITSNFASQAGTAVAGLDTGSATVYETGVSRFLANISAPTVTFASLSADRVVENPKTGSLIVADEILVTFRNAPSLQELEQVRVNIGGELIGSFPELRTYQFRVANVSTAGTLVSRVSSLQSAAVANSASYGFDTHSVVKLSSVPNDPAYSQNWGLQAIDHARNLSLLPEKGVGVAVIDSGIQRDHEDLRENIDLAKCINFSTNDLSNFDDKDGHGTHVAGIIAAKANNGRGSSGVAPNARIIAISVFDSAGNASDLNLAQAVKYAADQPDVRVINMSLGGPGMISRVLANAIDYASFKDKLVVVAAGNDQDDSTFYSPAHYERCLTVGATDNNDARAYFSNYGLPVDIAAPGDMIYSCYYGSTSSYKTLKGTSMAAPFVSGLAAAMFSIRPDMSADEVRRIIQSTADTISPDRPLGSGRINMTRALAEVSKMTVQNPPMLAISGPSNLPAEGYADFTVIAVDRDDTRVSFSWTSSGGAAPVVKKTEDLRSTVTWTAPDAGGQYVLTCRVTDSRGLVTTETHNVYVVPKAVSLEIVEPLSGPAGTIVTITGYDFGESLGISRVRFNGVEATEIISWSRTQIKVKVPAGTTSGTLVVVVGNDQSNGVNFLVNDLPGQPVFIAPVANAANQSRNPDLEASAFQTTNGLTHLSSDWEIYESDQTPYSRRVWESVRTTTYKRMIRVDVTSGRFINSLTGKSRLNSNTEYWVRVRYIDSNNQVGPWSGLQKFKTLVDADGNPPNRPAIVTFTAEQTTNPTLQGTAFYDADGDTHSRTDWEIYSSSFVAADTRVWSKQGDTENLSQIIVNSANGVFANSLLHEAGLLSRTTYYARVQYYDSTGASSGWSELSQFKTKLQPNKPQVASPSSGQTDVSINPVMTSTDFSGTDDGHVKTDWELREQPDASLTPVWSAYSASENLTSITISSVAGEFRGSLSGKTALEKGKLYYARLRYYDGANRGSEWSDFKSFFVTANSRPDQPAMTFPAENQMSIVANPVLRSGSFVDADSGDTHASSDWEIYEGSNPILSLLVWVKNSDTANLTSITVNSSTGSFKGTLSGQTQLAARDYWVRVRYRDSRGLESEWSELRKFSTRSNPPAKPTIQAFSSKQSTNPTVSATAFSDGDNIDTHLKSDWEVYDSDTVSSSNRVWYVQGDTANLSSTRVRVANGKFENALANEVGLLGNNTYFVRVRYYDNHSMVSPWSELVSFETLATPRTPKVTSPTLTMTDVGINPTLVGSDFAGCEPSDTHAKSSWEIYDDAAMAISNRVWYKLNDTSNKGSIVVNATYGTFVNSLSGKTSLDKRKTYYARVKYFDQGSNASEWSESTAFQVISNSPPNTPVVTYPKGIYSNVGMNTTLTINAFSDPDAGDVHGKTDWEIFNAANLTESSRVWSSIGNTTAKTTIIVNSANGSFENDLAGLESLEIGQDYWLRIRVYDGYGLGSGYSQLCRYTVVSHSAPRLSNSVVGDGSVTLSWSGVTPLALGYNVYYSTEEGFDRSTATKVFVEIDRLNIDISTVQEFEIKDLQNDVYYYFRVYIVDENGEQLGSNEILSFPNVDSISPVMIPVRAGTFQRNGINSNTATVSSFNISRFEVPEQLFWTIIGNPGYISTPNSPAVCNWYNAIAFCNKLSIKEGLTPAYVVSGVDFSTLHYSRIPTQSDYNWDNAVCDWSASGYRLPTEMEWMWAAMGADQDSRSGAMSDGVNISGYSKAYAGEGIGGDIRDFAWFAPGLYGVQQVGLKNANELGLYDMSGNALEWCWDRYATNNPSGALIDFRGADDVSVRNRVARGGSFYDSAGVIAVASRGSGYPYQATRVGFRVVRP